VVLRVGLREDSSLHAWIRNWSLVMRQVVVRRFGGVEVLEVEEVATPTPGAGEVLVRLTSIGVNHADLMARRGEYKIASGEPPFCPGLEGGGVIEAVGDGVDAGRVGERVALSPDAPRQSASGGGLGGTYRSHYVVPADRALVAPDAVPDEQLGALWLTYLTAWGCLVWRQNLKPGQVVALPAASSGVGLAAAQVVRQAGGVTVGLTTGDAKAEALRGLDTAAFDHVVVTHHADGSMRPWHKDMRAIARGGVDVFFDPVAAGEYLNTEIKCLAQRGTVWVYGLLGEPGVVDVTPLIRKWASIRGWVLGELVADEQAWRSGCDAIFAGFEAGVFRQRVDRVFRLDAVREAHEYMERGRHIGKLVLQP
jgi:NADPH2:quinone reductase